MHCIIERMEYLFPPLSYLTHHSALSGLLNLSQTLYLPSSHIHMSRSRYTYRPIQHSPPLFSLYVTHTPPKYHNFSLHHRHTHSTLSMTISHYPLGTHVLSPSIHTSISISLGASSITHTPCHSISHPCSPIMISRGSLYDKHTLSPPHVCIFSVCLSRPLSLACQTPVGHVQGVFLSRLQTITHYLLTLLPLSK